MEPVDIECTEVIHSMLHEGFWPRAEIVESARECLNPDEGQGDPNTTVLDLVENLWRQRVEEQVKWPQVTDCDRLDAAFKRLEDTGIIARQNLSSTFTSGMWEITDIAQRLNETKPGSAVGWMFYHSQDLERVAQTGELYLGFGSVEDPERSDQVLEIGRKIVTALNEAGLSTEWNESPETRIKVSLVWQKRLPSEA